MLNKLFFICILSTVYLIGCQKSESTLDYPSLPRHSLDIEGEVQLRGEVSWVDSTDELITKIWADNLGSDTATIKTGQCAFNLLAYSLTENSNDLIWHNKMPEEYICQDELLTYTIPPNDTIQVEGQVYISGDRWYWSVPRGKWKFVLEAKTEDKQSVKINANTVTIN